MVAARPREARAPTRLGDLPPPALPTTTKLGEGGKLQREMGMAAIGVAADADALTLLPA